MDIIKTLSEELKIEKPRVEAAVKLMDEGNTIPFIARYRKELTGALDDQQLREMGERLEYLRGLDKRRGEITSSMTELGVITGELRAKLDSARTLAELEDIYRPFKPKRRTRATIARERGLEKLATRLLLQAPRDTSPEKIAEAFITDEVPDIESALSGARDILAENISDDAALRKALRETALLSGVLKSARAKDEESVYAQYYDYREPVKRIPGHRVLAVNRGEKEGFLKVDVEMDSERVKLMIRREFSRGNAPTSNQVELACDDAWERLLYPSIERETRAHLTDAAQEAAIRVFSGNLRQLLMQPPVKGKVTLGVDPGFRTGCKLAVVDETGKVLETGVGYFTIPGMTQKRAEAKKLVTGMIARHGVTAVAIGNGTASRESEAFIAEVLSDCPGAAYMIVSEAGASVYSASKLAAEEFPEYDVSLRSAVSIARRMQDPLAELVKIDPKAIGVGQYQHDLKDAALGAALDGVIEDCVNSVGVEASTASAALLTHVAGIGPALAANIVAYREANGLKNRAELKKVPKLGPRAYEQCAGFLRVRDSDNPLDATAVHPESYKAASALLKKLGHKSEEIRRGALADLPARVREMGAESVARELEIGVMTLNDIASELAKPGRDPRDELPKPVLRTDVLDMDDLSVGMELTGTVRNVIDFGAFVDIGVHQDGLVHISRMANRFIKHPSEVVKVGDVVQVWVVEVDAGRKRIALTMIKPE